jgi:hypothetical protein
VIDVLQDLVDTLSARLQRSVAVDDAGLRLLASSAHFEDVDSARLGSLVGRRVSGGVRDYAMAAGVQCWHEPTMLPANPALGLERPRLGYPLRSRYELLGFMWLIDDGTLTDSDVDVAREWAERMEDLLTLKAQSTIDADVESEALLLALVTADASVRRQAADDLRDLGIFRRATAFSASVLKVAHDDERVAAAAARHGITQAMRSHPRDQVVHAIDSHRSILVVGHRVAPNRAQSSTAAEAVHAAVVRYDPGVAAVAAIGVGCPVDELDRVHQAVDQAMVAADVGLANGAPVTTWSDQPLDMLLQSWLRDGLPAHLVPPEIRRLEEQPAELVEIVREFLDACGNVAPIATKLHLHRTTIYYHLNRLRETAGIDLNDGPTRLMVHLWLKGRRRADAATVGNGPRPDV